MVTTQPWTCRFGQVGGPGPDWQPATTLISLSPPCSSLLFPPSPFSLLLLNFPPSSFLLLISPSSSYLLLLPSCPSSYPFPLLSLLNKCWSSSAVNSRTVVTAKLDGVGPNDNRPSPNRWHMTKCDTYSDVNILSKFQVPSSYSLGVKVSWKFGGKGWVS